MNKQIKTPIYQQPKITRIPLGPAQAILQQCVVGGAYFVLETPSVCSVTDVGPECPYSVRGYRGAQGIATSTDAQPS